MPNPSPASSPADSWLALDRQLCFALYAASLSMTRAYKPLLDPLGLTYPQYLAMLALWESDGIPVSALGDRLGLDSGTLTPLLKRLEGNGLLTRRRDPSDERRVLLYLSATGRALRQRAKTVPQRMAALAGCSLGDISELTERLTALRQHLSQAPA